MLTDHWVIAQLIAQACMLVLIGQASFSAVQMIRFWNPERRDELQLGLERKSYLVSAIFRLVLGFQFISLVLFVATVNKHLPGMIKGAMCATGVLDMNAIGYPLLALKSLSVLFYGVFLSLHSYDEREPGDVLTPYKFYWVLPAILLLIIDFILTISYYYQLSPDIIATCCSVAFVGNTGGAFFQGSAVSGVGWVLAGFGMSATVLAIVWWKKGHSWLLLIFTTSFLVFAIWSLKIFFVKYIYGLPSHTCLFDIFWGKYYYIGYGLFGGYYVLGFTAIAYAVLRQVSTKLSAPTKPTFERLKYFALLALLWSCAVPVLYWLLWEGNM